MYKVDIMLKSTAPLRMNKFNPECLTSPGGGKQSREQVIKYAEEKKVYKNGKGYYVPATAVKKAIVNGGKRVKSGRRAASTDLLAIFQLPVLQIPLLDSKGKQYTKIDGLHEEAVRVPPKTGAKAWGIWPMFDIGWKIKFTAEIWDDRFGENILKNSIIEAGIYAGLLDGRPDWGRFILDKFKRL